MKKRNSATQAAETIGFARNITVHVNRSRVAAASQYAKVITDNTDYTVTFDVDPDSGFDMTLPYTAVFVTDRGKQTVLANGPACTVPMLTASDGVFLRVGLTQGAVKTTAAARINIIPSINVGSGVFAPPASDNNPVVSEIDAADVLNINDASNGEWVRATISTLAACIAEIIGGAGSGDSHWSVGDNGELIPDNDIDLNDGTILNIAKLFFGSGAVGTPFAVGVRNLTALPSTAPIDDSECLVYLTTEERYYRYNATLSTWQKLPTLGDIDTHTITRLSTYANFEDLPVSASLQQYLARISRWYGVIASKQDAENGKGLSSNDYDNTAKAKVDAIPENPQYTDHIYDDTALVARISTIEGKETGWDSKYTKPAGGIPASDLAPGVIPPVMTGAASGAAGSAGLVPAPSAGDDGKYLRGDGTWATPPSGSGSSTTLPVVDELADDEIKQGILTATDDGGLTLTIEREVSSDPLDEIVCDGKSYRDIFVTNNVSPIKGFENGEYTDTEYTILVNAGSPVVSTEDKCTGTYSLKAFGTGSTQIKVQNTGTNAFNLPSYTSFYTACMAKCTRYTKGYLGVQHSNSNNVAVNAVTNGWVRCGKIVNTSNYSSNSIYAGSWSTADLDGYVDDVVVINMSIFTNAPTEAQLNELYDNYIAILQQSASGTQTETVTFDLVGNNASGGSDTEPSEPTSYTDDECRAAFVSEMNKRAALIGMSNSTFLNASGLYILNNGTYSYNTSTAMDMLRLLVYASGIAPLAKIWNKDAYTVPVKGSNPRNISLETSVTDNTFEASYHIYGGKTGSIGTGLQNARYNLMAITSAPDGNMFAGVIIGASSANNRWTAFKQLLDVAAAKYADPSYDTSQATVNASYAAVMVLPKNNPLMYDGAELSLLYSKSASTVDYPASMSKVLSAVILCEWVPDLHERLTIKTADNIGGSGPAYADGDSITFEEALYSMMLPSSNTCAEAVSRVVGERILRARDGSAAATLPSITAAIQAAIAALPRYDGTVS